MPSELPTDFTLIDDPLPYVAALELRPLSQIDGLLALLHRLQAELPALRFIAGHEDLDTTRVPASDEADVLVQRKLDPGPMFPWERVLESTPLQRLMPL